MTMHGTPQYDTRWYDSRKRTTRIGFEAGCVERKPVHGMNGKLLPNVEVTLYLNKVHNVYMVKRSDWNTRVTGASDPTLRDYWWEGKSLKEARKMLNAIAKGETVSVLDLMVEESKVCEAVNE